MEQETSEFGKGFIYNLMLFTKHFQNRHDYNDQHDKQWLYGAADHLFEMDVPERFKGTEIEKLATKLRTKVLERRLELNSPKEEMLDLFEDIENPCLLIDKELGAEPVKATWN